MSNIETNRELQKLTPSAMVTMYIIDATDIGGEFLRFYPGTNHNGQPLVWQGNSYISLPMEARGFEFKGTGAPPRPSLFLSNIGGQITALCLAFNDLLGARVTRKRTWLRFLDGQPGADPNQGLPDDVFFIERKASETMLNVEFELATRAVIDDLMLPGRRVFANLCEFLYRSTECSHAGGAVANIRDEVFSGLTVRGQWNAGATYHVNDEVWIPHPRVGRRYYVATFESGSGITGAIQGPPNRVFWTADECSHKVAGCDFRHGTKPEGLPFGAYPGTRRLGA